MESGGTCVVAVETGARRPTFGQELGRCTVIYEQRADESPAAFAERIEGALAAVAQGDVVLGLLACGDRAGLAVRRARHRVATALASGLSREGSAEILLSAHAASPAAVRDELFALAGDLCAQFDGAPLSVRLRFDAPPPRALRAVRPVSVVPLARASGAR